MLHGFLSRPNSSFVSSVGESEVFRVSMFTSKPETVLNGFTQLLIVFLPCSYFVERIGPKTVFIVMPGSHFGLSQFVFIVIEEQTQKLIEVIEDLLVTPLSQFHACLSSDKYHQDIVFRAGVDESNRIFVVFLSLQDEVNPTFTVSPERILEGSEEFVLESVANAQNRLLVRFRQRRIELNEVSLQNSQRNRANHSFCLVDLSILSAKRDNRTVHVNPNNSCVKLNISLATLVESLEKGGVTTSQRNNVIFSMIFFLAICPSRHVFQFNSFDVGLQIEFPIHNILGLPIFFTEFFPNIVTDSFRQRHVLMTIVAFLVSSIDSLLEEFFSFLNALTAIHWAFILVVKELAIDHSFHGFTVFFFHELSDRVVFFWTVNESSTHIDLHTCEVIGVDSASNSVPTFKDDVGTSALGKSLGGSDSGHSSPDDNHLMNLLHTTFLKLRYFQSKAYSTYTLLFSFSYQLNQINSQSDDGFLGLQTLKLPDNSVKPQQYHPLIYRFWKAKGKQYEH